MKRPEIRDRVEAWAKDLGIPAYCIGDKIVPSMLHFDIVLRDGVKVSFAFAAGTPEIEVERTLKRIKDRMILREEGQMDLEDALRG